MPDAPRLDPEYFTSLAQAVGHLASHDTALARFGAQRHRYAFAPPLTTARIAEIERAHRCKLPEDYVAFVTRVGSAGAGPHYGLLPLDVPSQRASLEGEFPHTESISAEDLPEPEQAAFMSDAAVKGTIALTHAGCCYFSILVVRGPARGEVWFDFRSVGGPLAPAYESFQGFYAHWLSELIKGEVVPLELPPKVCALPQALDEVVGTFEKEHGLPHGTAKEEHIMRALGAIPDGAIALSASGPEMARYFDEDDPVDPCASCAMTIATLVEGGAMRWTQIGPGGPAKAARGK